MPAIAGFALTNRSLGTERMRVFALVRGRRMSVWAHLVSHDRESFPICVCKCRSAVNQTRKENSEVNLNRADIRGRLRRQWRLREQARQLHFRLLVPGLVGTITQTDFSN